jgi:hypothetical protein
VYLANGRIFPSAGDDIPNRLIPFSILRWETLTLDPFRDELQGEIVNPWYVLDSGGHLMSAYPPGTAILALPIYVPCYLWLRAHGHTNSLYLFKASATAEKLAAAIMAACSVAILFLLVRLRANALTAVIIALAFGLGTGMWVIGSQLLWQHGPGVLCLLLGMYCLARSPGPWGSAAAGFFLAAAVAVRPQNALFAVAGAAVAGCRAGGGQRARSLLAFCAGSLLPLAATVAYDEHYLGNVLGGYSTRYQVGQLFKASALLRGLPGLVLSPNRGLLWFSPVALVGVWGMFLAFRRWRADLLLASFSAAAVAYALLHASFGAWTGGGCFGPRYLTETLPVLALAASVAVPRLTVQGRVIALILAAWSILVEIDGAVCYPTSRWAARMQADADAASWDLGHLMLVEDFDTWRAQRGRMPPRPVVLADSAFKVDWLKMAWRGRDALLRLRPKIPVRALVTFRNAGNQTWPDAAAADPARSGKYAVRLAYRWRNASWLGPYSERVDLTEPLAPGQATTLQIPVITPAMAGDYDLQLDLVQERVAWFESRGARRFQVPMRVERP